MNSTTTNNLTDLELVSIIGGQGEDMPQPEVLKALEALKYFYW